MLQKQKAKRDYPHSFVLFMFWVLIRNDLDCMSDLHSSNEPAGLLPS